MKKTWIIIFLLFGLVFVGSCKKVDSSEVKNYDAMPRQAEPGKDSVCSPPYIKFKNSCFIDQDGDGIWDFLPADCSLEKGMGCTDMVITKDGIAVFLYNQMGFDIEKITVDIVGCGSTSAGLTYKGYLANKNQDMYAISCLLTGPTFAGNLSVAYTNVDTKVTHTLRGVLAGNIKSKSINEYLQKYLNRN